MAELADALDLGSSSERSEGSSPFIRIFNFAIAQLLGDIKPEDNCLSWYFLRSLLSPFFL